MIKKVLEHTCFQKEHPLSPVGCRCRHYITTDEATDLVVQELAQYVITGRRTASVEEVCRVCGGQEKLTPTCDNCTCTGRVTVIKETIVYGDDIIRSAGLRGKRLANVTAKKTPRSPTIEQGHMERLVGVKGGDKVTDAAARVLEYGMLTLKERLRLLVIDLSLEKFETAWKQWKLESTQPFPLEIRLEPEDDLKKHTGRKYDFGRSV